ncbi:MAG: type II toxin-antitoxin system VapC family toxin [Defluviitaleaceae bacterium]|nr:type II toxin-antitoxin system VapC family toxin [Defluviitaleaceae bacterium]
MKYLMDTHTALWLFEGNSKLPKNVLDIISDAENEIYISVVSAWEVAIKVSLNKLDFDGGAVVFLSAIEANNIVLLGVKGDYIKLVENLPFIHRDPFDRLLITTAMIENLAIITIDENIKKYDVQWVW